MRNMIMDCLLLIIIDHYAPCVPNDKHPQQFVHVSQVLHCMPFQGPSCPTGSAGPAMPCSVAPAKHEQTVEDVYHRMCVLRHTWCTLIDLTQNVTLKCTVLIVLWSKIDFNKETLCQTLPTIYRLSAISVRLCKTSCKMMGLNFVRNIVDLGLSDKNVPKLPR